ncbi:MAG: DNA-directed RNA polymerase subunit D [DPANN group archaeon]|nr:DNA-directed RNA polymerase subunit D [DPANN group archaeon]
MVTIKMLEQSENEIKLVLDKTTPEFVNEIRRASMFEVPTLAIDDVYFTQNSSALYDEMLAHRLGLVVLKTPKGYNLPSECTCSGKLCAKCSVKMTLRAKGPVTVYAKDMKIKDPDVKVVHPETVIVKLLENQEVELEAVAILGKGLEHAKWNAGHVYYLGMPEIEATKDADAKTVLENVPIVEKSGKGLEIKNIAKWTEAYGEICQKNGFVVKNSDSQFIFTLESWGSKSPQEIMSEAVEVIEQKAKNAKL